MWTWRRVLHWLLLWWLNLAQPAVVVLGLDTIVTNNDQALEDESCQARHKKVRGFQPLQMT